MTARAINMLSSEATKLKEKNANLENEHKIMKEALISICHLYKVNANDQAPFIARETLAKLK